MTKRQFNSPKRSLHPMVTLYPGSKALLQRVEQARHCCCCKCSRGATAAGISHSFSHRTASRGSLTTKNIAKCHSYPAPTKLKEPRDFYLRTNTFIVPFEAHKGQRKVVLAQRKDTSARYCRVPLTTRVLLVPPFVLPRWTITTTHNLYVCNPYCKTLSNFIIFALLLCRTAP